ncbi:hypothetical protein B0H11DRAFT_2028278 [Mycena galericulata]|nr:hypothetical protein B0H11DRAFT_2028278 [Mycena galericulata]
MVLTRSARRAQKDITRLFPDELITEIVRNAVRADQATLCRVSKLFQSLSLPVLNRTVVLNTFNSKIPRAFCSALIANPGRADTIRSFTFVFRSPAYEDLFLEAMKLMTRLERLSIAKTPVLSLLHFPRLISCGVQILGSDVDGISGADIVSQFLTRHPTLTHVEMNSLQARPVEERIPLPNLCHYGGTALAIPEICLCRLRTTRLNWFLPAGTPTIDQIILALNALTTLDRPFVSSHYCFTGVKHLVILKSLSTHMPHTTTLQMRFIHSELDDEDFEQFTECLPLFHRLAYLALDYIYEFPRTVAEADHDFGTVQKLAAVCPTLEACSLYDNAWRKVNGTWQEYPREDFLVSAGLNFPRI